jgi:hypothetical protein
MIYLHDDDLDEKAFDVMNEQRALHASFVSNP